MHPYWLDEQCPWRVYAVRAGRGGQLLSLGEACYITSTVVYLAWGICSNTLRN